MTIIKHDEKGRIISNKKNNSTKKNNSKLNTNKPKPTTKFIAFYRNEGNDLWGLHPQALSSEESVINKIKLTYGDVEMHIVSTELPA